MEIKLKQVEEKKQVETLLSALCKAQSQFKEIPKKAQGHGYKYAPLEVVWAVIRKPLTDNGLSIIQKIDTFREDNVEEYYLTTILGHGPSGQREASVMRIPRVHSKKMNEIQALGASVTYLRRYALSAILSLTTEEDTDAQDLNVPRTGGRISPDLVKEIADRCLVDVNFKTRTERLIDYFGVHDVGDLPKIAEAKIIKALGEKNDEEKS